MQLKELFGKAGIACPTDAEAIEITNIVTDSRRVTQGSLFVCQRGTKTDGHEYIDQAIKNGAAVIVAEQKRDVCVGGAAAYIMLDNTRRVAALLYNAWYGRPTEKLKIIGVTGTNGKTSVTTLLYDIFKSYGYKIGLIGTVCHKRADGRPLSLSKEGSTMTTPDPEQLYHLLSELAKEGAEYVVMEVSSHALALCKTDAITFDIGVFTNLTMDHLDFHGSMEEYYKSKRKLFSQSRKALVCIDGEYGKRLCQELSGEKFTVSVTEGDFCALSVNCGSSGISYILKAPRESVEIKTPLIGSFNVINSLMSASLACLYGIPLSHIAKALSQSRGVRGRMEKVQLPPSDITVIVDYAHTPDALEKLLLSVRELREPKSKLILLFGCGGERDREKRRIMAQIASRLSDFTIVTSDNARGEDPSRIFSDILKGIDKEKPYTVIEDRREAIEYAVNTAKHGDIIVLAGKGHENYEITARGILPFSEAEIVKEAFVRRQDIKGEEN